MIDNSIFRLTPKRFYCPLCGNWHDWEGQTLQSYDEDNPYEYECCDGVEIRFWCKYDSIYIQSSAMCDKVNNCIDDEVSLKDMECDATDPVIKFSTFVSTDEIVCSEECDFCSGCNGGCNLPSIGDERCNDDDEFKLELKFKFEFAASKYFDKYAHTDRRQQELAEQREQEAKRQQELAEQREQEAKRQQELAEQREQEAKRQQELAEQQEQEAKRQQELAEQQEQETKRQHKSKKTAKKCKEDTTMAKNIFNMSVEFGPNKDENIASTLMGVAVKNGDSWRIYDKKKKKITDVGDMQLGNLPIFIFPTTKLSEGDLIKDAGEYYFVVKVQEESTQTLCAKTGEMKTVVPIKNVLGFSCYSKVIALSDSLNIGDDIDVEKSAIMLAMFDQTGENGGQMNQLLPLMLFKDKLGGDEDMMKMFLMSSMMASEDDGGKMNSLLPLMLFKDKLGEDDEEMMKMLLMSSMMTSEDDGSKVNQLLPLMIFKDKLGGDEDMMKMFLMSSMMGDNMAGSNNPLMGYLMLDTFMSKKDDKSLQQTDNGTAE